MVVAASHDSDRDPFGLSFRKDGNYWLNTPHKQIKFNRRRKDSADTEIGRGTGVATSTSNWSHSFSRASSSGSVGHSSTHTEANVSPGLLALSGQSQEQPVLSPIQTKRKPNKKSGNSPAAKSPTSRPHSPSTRLDLYSRGNVSTFALNARNYKGSFKSMKEFTETMVEEEERRRKDRASQRRKREDEEESVVETVEDVEELDNDPLGDSVNGGPKASTGNIERIPTRGNSHFSWSPIKSQRPPPSKIEVKESSLSALAGEQDQSSDDNNHSPGFRPDSHFLRSSTQSKTLPSLAQIHSKSAPNLAQRVRRRHYNTSDPGCDELDLDDNSLVIGVQRALVHLKHSDANDQSMGDVMTAASQLSGLMRSASYQRQRIDGLLRRNRDIINAKAPDPHP